MARERDSVSCFSRNWAQSILYYSTQRAYVVGLTIVLGPVHPVFQYTESLCSRTDHCPGPSPSCISVHRELM